MARIVTQMIPFIKSDMADKNRPILVGSIIHLKNGGAAGGYLDSRGWVQDKPAFWNVSGSERSFVSTHASRNRDRDSGSWRVESAAGQPEGTPLKIGDTIHLLNMFPGVGYLDCCGWIEHLAPFAPYQNEVTCGVFTCGLPNRDNGTGLWQIQSATKAVGDPLLEGDAINLVNGHPNTGALVTYGRVTENQHFQEYSGQGLFAFTAVSESRKAASGAWQLSLSDVQDNKLLFNFFGPELLKGRANNMKGVMDMSNILLGDAFQAVGGLAIKDVAALVSQAGQRTPADNDQQLQALLDKAKSAANHDLTNVIDHPFQIKQLLNLYTLTRTLVAFDQNTLQKLMLQSLTQHQQDKTLPPLHLIRNCFRRTATDHEIIQRATVQRRWNQDEPGKPYYQSEQAVELVVMDKLAIRALTPFQHLLPNDSGPLAVITYFSDTTHIHHLPYTDRFILVGVSYDRVTLTDDLSDDETLTGKDFSAFELMAIPHEVGHYLYQHGRLKDGRTFPQVSQKFKDNPYYRWCEEIFADLYGCLVAGPLSVFSIQAFLTSGDKARVWRDDEEHPTPLLRSYLLSEILRVLSELNENVSQRYRFPSVTKNLDEDWTEILGQWGYEGLEKEQSRPTRIYLPDSSAAHMERIVNVERVLKAVRPIIKEYATLLLGTAAVDPLAQSSAPPQSAAIPWSQGDSDDSAHYAREMATLAGWGTAREPIAHEVLLDVAASGGGSAQQAVGIEAIPDERDADERLQAYLDNWGESGPHGWGGH